MCTLISSSSELLQSRYCHFLSTKSSGEKHFAVANWWNFSLSYKFCFRSREAFFENISTALQREEKFLPPANKKVNIGRWERKEEENLHLKRNIATQKKTKGKKFELFHIEQEKVKNENLRVFPQSIFRWKLLYCYLITMKRHPCTLGGLFPVLFLYWISQRVVSMGCWRVPMRKQLRYVLC